MQKHRESYTYVKERRKRKISRSMKKDKLVPVIIRLYKFIERLTWSTEYTEYGNTDIKIDKYTSTYQNTSSY